MAANQSNTSSRLPRYKDLDELLKRAASGEKEAVDTTLTYLNSSNANLRRIIHSALHEQREPAIWRCLIGLLSLGLWGDAGALLAAGGDYQQQLQGWLPVDWHEDRFHSLAGAFMLDESNPERLLKDALLEEALQASTQRLSQEPGSSVMQNIRFACAYLSGLRGHAQVIPILDEIIEQGDLGWKLLAVQALTALHDPRAAPPLVKALASSRKVLHQEARRALSDLGHLAEKAWVEALNHPDTHIRWHAARALSQIGDPRAVKVLAEGLHDSNHTVRWTTARVLASMDATALPAILEQIAHRPLEENFRQACYHALHAMPSARTQQYVRPLLEALNRPGAAVQAPQLAFSMLKEWERK